MMYSNSALYVHKIPHFRIDSLAMAFKGIVLCSARQRSGARGAQSRLCQPHFMPYPREPEVCPSTSCVPLRSHDVLHHTAETAIFCGEYT